MAADFNGRSVVLELRQQHGRKPDGHPGTEGHNQRSGRGEHLSRIVVIQIVVVLNLQIL